MAISPTDKGNEFMESGMTLITQISSEKYLQKVKKTKEYEIKNNDNNTSITPIRN